MPLMMPKKRLDNSSNNSGAGYLDFYPFFLDGVALEPMLNQSDGIHPNENGVAEIVKRIKPSVEILIAQIKP